MNYLAKEVNLYTVCICAHPQHTHWFMEPELSPLYPRKKTIHPFLFPIQRNHCLSCVTNCQLPLQRKLSIQGICQLKIRAFDRQVGLLKTVQVCEEKDLDSVLALTLKCGVLAQATWGQSFTSSAPTFASRFSRELCSSLST